MFQKTIRDKVTTSGFGIFTRKLVKLTILPAPEDSGIVINGLPVNLQNISPLPYRLSLRGILMPEHLLSACYGLGIDNLEIDLSGKEFPFFDGSSREYLNLLKSAGIKEQNKPVEFFSPRSPLIEFHNGSFIALLPGENSRGNLFSNLAVEIFFSNPDLNIHSLFSLPKFTPAAYEKEIVWARSFGKYPEPSFLEKMNLSFRIKRGILHPKRLRSANEFVRHKLLDLFGDLRILGKYICGKILAYNPSHKLNYKLLSRIAQKEKIWILIK